MTPATQEELLLRRDYRILRPEKVWIADGDVVWSDDGEASHRVPNPDELVPDYCLLASASDDDDEAAGFVRKWGVPELGGWIDANGTLPDWDDPLTRPTRLPVFRMREHALAVAATRRIGAALSARRPGDPADWKAANRLLNPSSRRTYWVSKRMATELGAGWQVEREHFGTLISDALQGAGVVTAANWVDHDRLTLMPACKGLVGVVMLLVAREVGAGREFTCTSCGAPVVRRRAPLEGERVYCDRSECKREQRRRNQAAWRARKAGGR